MAKLKIQGGECQYKPLGLIFKIFLKKIKTPNLFSENTHSLPQHCPCLAVMFTAVLL